MSTLEQLINAKLVWWDNKTEEYRGTASDGTEVSLGHSKETTERYLTDHPSPEDW